MLIRQIQYFTAVVEYKSFTEAAERCFISQSAISQQMQALEKELGVKLLERQKRRLRLTPAGEYFYNAGKELLDELETLCRETIRIGQDEELLLRIGYPRDYGSAGLRKAVSEFSQTYPEVFLHIRSGSHDELCEALGLGEIDLLLCDLRRTYPDGCAVRRLPPTQCHARLSVQNRLSRRSLVTIEELRRTPCILIASGCEQNAEQEYYKNTLGLHMGFLFAATLEEAELMTAGNRGFLLLGETEGPDPPDSPFRTLPLLREQEPLTRSYGVLWQKGRNDYYMEEFAGMLEGCLLSPAHKKRGQPGLLCLTDNTANRNNSA